MAIYYARKSGNVNATDVWATSPSGTAGDFFPSFTSADTLMANGFTITINTNLTVLEIRNDTTGGATSGGSLSISSTITINANIICNFIYSGTGSMTIIGNVTTFPVSGGISAGGANNSSGTINIIGNIIGLTGNGRVLYNSIGIINITGNLISNTTGSSVTSLYNAGNGTINITGNVYGHYNSVSYGIENVSTGTVNIVGNCIGGALSGSVAVLNSNMGSVNITGTCIGGIAAVGVNNTSTGTITVTRAKGNGFGPGSVGLSSTVGLSNSQTGTAKVYEIEYGDLGQSPTSGPIEMVTANSNVAVFAVRLSTKKTLVDLNNSVNLIPSSGNVRNGTSYNYGNNIGSCVIPNPNSVVYGVPVDNTVGSGLLSPVAVWNALTSSIGTSGSIGERLKNCSTVSIVGKQLEGVL